MERISEKRLPPIFEMSVLWNILPYYGHLHRWRRLLEKINTETKEIWDQNREQLKYIGRDFKREIELDNLKNKYARHLRPNRSWLDLFSLSLSKYFNIYIFDFTILIENLSKDEVIIVDSHDDIFKGYQIHYWSKDRISDIIPAVNCPSFKSETNFFKTSEKYKITDLIYDQNHTKSIVIENTDEKLSINLVYGNTIKIGPSTFNSCQKTKFLDKLIERYKLWKIGDCACKPKKIRIQKFDFAKLQYTINKLLRISNINDVKVGMNIECWGYFKSFSNYDTIVFNHSTRWMSDKETNFMFTGDKLAVISCGNCYNFRLEQRKKESEDSYIKGKI